MAGLFYFSRTCTLLEDQLGELVQAVFPDDEVVLAFRVFDERAGDAVLVAEGLEAGAVVHQVVFAVLLGASVGHHYNHRNGLPVSNEVVQILLLIAA